MKGKKLAALLLAVTTLAGSVLAGCGGEDAPRTPDTPASTEGSEGSEGSGDSQEEKGGSGEKVQVNVWFGSDAMSSKEAIVEAFNQEQDGIEVIASYYDTDGLKDALKVAASSNTLPDTWRTYGGSLGGYFVDNGLCKDMTDYAAEHGWDQIFTPGPTELCTYDGKLYGYPCSYNVITMWYRKDIFEQNNLEVPTTFEEFEQVCATLKEKGITPISTAGLNGWHVMRLVELLIEHYAGAELHDSLNNFEASWDCDAVVQALAKYKEFCDKGYFPDGFVTADPDNTNMAVFAGTAAMDIDGQWFDSNCVTNEQDTSLFGAFSLPTGGTNRVSAFAEMFQFSKDITPEKLDATIAFLDYYLSDENVEKYPDGYNLPLPKYGASVPEGQPHVEEVFNMSNENGTFAIADQVLPAEVADVLFNAQAAIANDEMTPEEAAKAIQAGIEAHTEE